MLFKNFFLLNFFHLEPVKCVSQEDSAIKYLQYLKQCTLPNFFHFEPVKCVSQEDSAMLMDNTLCSVQRIYSAFF